MHPSEQFTLFSGRTIWGYPGGLSIAGATWRHSSPSPACCASLLDFSLVACWNVTVRLRLGWHFQPLGTVQEFFHRQDLEPWGFACPPRRHRGLPSARAATPAPPACRCLRCPNLCAMGSTA